MIPVTVFLKVPAGLPVVAESFAEDAEDLIDFILTDQYLLLRNEKRHAVIVPADNIASIEVRQA